MIKEKMAESLENVHTHRVTLNKKNLGIKIKREDSSYSSIYNKYRII